MVCSILSASSPCMLLPLNIEPRCLASSLNPISETPSTEPFQKFNSPGELKQVHALYVKTSTPLSALSLPRVASVCALNPSFTYAQQIFQHIQQPELFIWNSCLKDLAAGDSPSDAVLLFHQLRSHNVLPDSFTCSFVLKACVRLLDLAHGRIIHALIEKLGLQSIVVLQNVVVNLYASCGEMSDALLLFDKVPQRDIVTWNTMITQLVKSGDADSAYKVFVQMPERNVRSWTAMISGFVQCKKPKEAIEIFTKMEESQAKPNEVTAVAVLAACADLGMLDLGRRIHKFSIKNGFGNNIHVCNTLIDMYIKCGCIEAALKVFEGMKEPTVFSWSAMIQGLAIHGQAEGALKLFFDMIQTNTKPNGVTFIGLLNACSHLGLVDEGRRFFASMTRDYQIVPTIEHYGCMVDLLSRGGLLEEAHELIRRMPIQPNEIVWGGLLGGCKVHRNVELAEIAMNHLQELDSLNDGYYVVMANVYSEAKRWEDAANIRKLMKSMGLKKTQGWSSVNVNGTVQEFVAGDDMHPQSEEIFQTWNRLLVQMRLRGYVPNTSVVLLDLEESEKEKFLSRHSEKLALAYALINTKQGETIRIFKNLRVCEDCHASFKLASDIVGRKIVVRDRNRFHCFKDGSCSCRDYW